jgi:hypothetical protein
VEGIWSVPKQDLKNAEPWIDSGNHNSANDVVFSDFSVVVFSMINAKKYCQVSESLFQICHKQMMK